MKRIKRVGTPGLTMIALIFIANTLMAQTADSARVLHRKQMAMHPRHQGDMMGIPNLTDDQKSKIKAQRVAFGKEALPLTNQLIEKRAHLRTLQTAQPYDANAVNATIDDISKTESQLMKKQAANREAIRKLLNDEQRLAFDSRKSFGRGARFHGKHRSGHRN
ncbi:MAG TPA: periplasmic heavy metal sensor [Cyclobacteriaceae bacterium]|nr:periplasmic heavy metal sensor [Cyclobacteriaceae bacterium]